MATNCPHCSNTPCDRRGHHCCRCARVLTRHACVTLNRADMHRIFGARSQRPPHILHDIHQQTDIHHQQTGVVPGWRFATPHENIHRPGPWVVYRPSTSGRWGRASDTGHGEAINPVTIPISALDSPDAEERLGWRAAIAITRDDVVTRRWPVDTVQGVPTALDPDPAMPDRAVWLHDGALVWGWLIRDVHIPRWRAQSHEDAERIAREARSERAASARAARSERRAHATRWITRESLRAVGACDAGIDSALPAVARALGVPVGALRDGTIGAVRADVIARVAPGWAHGYRRP